MGVATITVVDRSTVEAINEKHRLCEEAWETAKDHAIEAGRLLAGVKAQLRHGEFGPWLEQHFDGSPRTAQTYMQIASAPEEKRNAVADSPSLRQARDAVSRPRQASASDTIGLLRTLGGSDTGEPGAEVEPRAPVESAWTPQLERKSEKAADLLADAAIGAGEARKPGLSAYARADMFRKASISARQAAGALEELAFAFER